MDVQDKMKKNFEYIENLIKKAEKRHSSDIKNIKPVLQHMDRVRNMFSGSIVQWTKRASAALSKLSGPHCISVRTMIQALKRESLLDVALMTGGGASNAVISRWIHANSIPCIKTDKCEVPNSLKEYYSKNVQIRGSGHGRRIKFSRDFFIQRVIFSVVVSASHEIQDKNAENKSLDDFAWETGDAEVSTIKNDRTVSLQDKIKLFSSIEKLHGVYVYELHTVSRLSDDRADIIKRLEKQVLDLTQALARYE